MPQTFFTEGARVIEESRGFPPAPLICNEKMAEAGVKRIKFVFILQVKVITLFLGSYFLRSISYKNSSRQPLGISFLKSHKLGKDSRERYHRKKQGKKTENSIFKSLLTFLICLWKFYYYLCKVKLWFESKI